jgi:hypothetical protein
MALRSSGTASSALPVAATGNAANTKAFKEFLRVREALETT